MIYDAISRLNFNLLFLFSKSSALVKHMKLMQKQTTSAMFLEQKCNTRRPAIAGKRKSTCMWFARVLVQPVWDRLVGAILHLFHSFLNRWEANEGKGNVLQILKSCCNATWNFFHHFKFRTRLKTIYIRTENVRDVSDESIAGFDWTNNAIRGSFYSLK